MNVDKDEVMKMEETLEALEPNSVSPWILREHPAQLLEPVHDIIESS